MCVCAITELDAFVRWPGRFVADWMMKRSPFISRSHLELNTFAVENDTQTGR